MRTHVLPPLLLSLALVPLGIGAAAPPDQPPAASAPAVGNAERAVELFRQGNEQYKQDRYEEAERLYAEAWDLAKTYDIAANYGHTEFLLGKHRRAAELLSFALARWPQTGQTPARQAASDRLVEAEQHVAAATLAVSVAGAEVALDGIAVGAAPLETPLFLDPGTHTITAELAGFEGASRTVEAQAGQRLEVALTLSPQSSGPPPPPAAEPTEPLPLWPAFVAGGAGLVLVGVGAALAAVGSGQESDADSRRASLETELLASGARCPAAPGCSELDGLYGDARTSQNVGRGLLVAGVGVGAAALVYVIVRGTTGDASSEPDDAARGLQPLFGPGLVGVSVSGCLP